MPSITLTISDDSLKVLSWSAAERRMTVDELVNDSIASFIKPLASQFAAAHKAEAADLFPLLTPDQQVEILASIKDAIRKQV